MTDESYVRRLKKANYGKWYIKPEDYNNRVDFITKQMNKQQKIISGEIDD